MAERGPDGRFLSGNPGRKGPRTKRELANLAKARLAAASSRKVRVALTPGEATLLITLVENTYYKGDGRHRRMCANILRKLTGENSGGY